MCRKCGRKVWTLERVCSEDGEDLDPAAHKQRRMQEIGELVVRLAGLIRGELE